MNDLQQIQSNSTQTPVTPLNTQGLPPVQFGQAQQTAQTIKLSPESAPITIEQKSEQTGAEKGKEYGYDAIKQIEARAEKVAEAPVEKEPKVHDAELKEAKPLDGKLQTPPPQTVTADDKKKAFPKVTGYDLPDEWLDPEVVATKKAAGGDLHLAETAAIIFLDRLLRKNANKAK